MKVFRKAALATILCGTLVAAAAAQAGDTHKGSAKVQLSYAYALQKNGTPLPEKDAACAGLMGSPKGSTVATTYSVNTKTLIESATSVVTNPSLPPGNKATYKLHPLGIEGQYAFGTYMSGTLYAVLFSVSGNFTDPVSSMVTSGKEFNCLFTSQENAASGAMKLRLGSAP
jgi:hypothetical protein